MQNHHLYFLLKLFIYGSAKRPDEKKKVKTTRKLWQNLKFSSSPFTSKMPVSTNQFWRVFTESILRLLSVFLFLCSFRLSTKQFTENNRVDRLNSCTFRSLSSLSGLLCRGPTFERILFVWRLFQQKCQKRFLEDKEKRHNFTCIWDKQVLFNCAEREKNYAVRMFCATQL